MMVIISAISCTAQHHYPATITKECGKSPDFEDDMNMPHGLPFETWECSATGIMNKDEAVCSGMNTRQDWQYIQAI